MGVQQVHCANVGRQGQSGEHLFLEFPRQSIHLSIYQTSDSSLSTFLYHCISMYLPYPPPSLSIVAHFYYLLLFFLSAGPSIKTKAKKYKLCFFMKRKQRLVSPRGLGLLASGRSEAAAMFRQLEVSRGLFDTEEHKKYSFFCARRGPEK